MYRYGLAGLWLVCLILTWTGVSLAEFKTGDIYHGFKLLEKRFVKEVNAECLYFQHQKSGARLLKIASSDENKTFSIAFKTVPESDCGTPHIMEHSVLNGSKNFPVKSPFDILSQGSLNTFLNAMTGSDITIYPVASMNDKDYFNLMNVYLDAVLYPLIDQDPRIFKQEGWHYELTDPDSQVTFKGVVYNEMKGAFSSPTRELDYRINQQLFPESSYRFCSGGYPTAIPELTAEAFLDFHRRYYHPSNSYIFLYGNADLDKELDFIDQNYLSTFDNTKIKPQIPIQKPFSAMKSVVSQYPVLEGDPTENQTYLTLSYVIGLNTDRRLVMALNILANLLVNQESAPLRLALQKAGIGKEVSASVDDIQQNVFQIVVQNANTSDKERFVEVVHQALKDVLKQGLDQQAVQGILNRIEFNLREGDDAQKGLTYNFQALPGWFFKEDPFVCLEYEKILTALKKSISEGYLESLINQSILQNPHSLMLALEPQPGLEKELNTKNLARLNDYQAGLTETQKQKLVKETQELMEYQQREDTPEALATIPMLDLSDINPAAQRIDAVTIASADMPILHCDQFTNGVVYPRFYFDLRVLPQELIPYAALLTECLGNLNTEHYTYGELEKALNIHTGGFNTYLTSYLENYSNDHLQPKLVVSGKAMADKLDKLFELTEEIINHSRYDQPDRLKEIITRYQARLEAQVKQNGYGYARTRLLSYLGNQGMLNELKGGIEYVRFITELSNQFDNRAAEISEKLRTTATLLFNRSNGTAAVTCPKPEVKAFQASLERLTQKLTSKPGVLQNWKFEIDPKNEGFMTTSKVQYVLKGYDYKKLGFAWNGKMRVLNQILSSDWLQSRIRVMGGAYGGFSSFGPDGMAYFASYRDPNLRETLANYNATPDYLKTLEVDDKTMTRYIIGTIADMDQPMTPSEKGDLAFRRHFEKIGFETIQQERHDVLSTKIEDIKLMEKMVRDVLSRNNYCVYGNEEKVKSNQDLFKITTKILP
ncbi:MAG: insulinase family protein [Candidatus Delongbacteria bacterium]|nr:insulinase family protein [Candidatus Delongbacteria bacterium]